MDITSFEWPWVREWRSVANDKLLDVTVRAGVILSAREERIDSARPREQLAHVLLVPDLGTAPIAGILVARVFADHPGPLGVCGTHASG